MKKARNRMKSKVSGALSSVNIDDEAVSYNSFYKMDVIDFDAEVSISTGFEIDCQVTVQVAVEADEGVVIFEGQSWFYNLAETSGNRNLIRIDDLKVKESRVSDAALEQFLSDGHDLVVEIKFSA